MPERQHALARFSTLIFNGACFTPKPFLITPSAKDAGFFGPLLGLWNAPLKHELIAPPARPTDVLPLQDLDAPPIDHVEQECPIAERSADKVDVLQADRRAAVCRDAQAVIAALEQNVFEHV